MNRRKVLLITAVIVAVLGTGLVFLYVQGAEQRAEERFQTVDVLRAVAPIEPGESIDDAATNGKLALQPVTQADLLPNAQTSIEELSGTVALTRIYPGEQIISEKFGSEPEAAASPLQIPAGQLAISISLSDTGRVAGFVNPGAEVVVFLNGTGPDGQTARVLLPRVRVLAVGSTTPATATATAPVDGEPAPVEGEPAPEQLPRTMMTLALDQEDAQRVLLAQASGELSFGLLGGSTTVKPDLGITIDNLFR